MSADNWMRCPNCLRLAGLKLKELKKAADEAYGKVPREEWQKLWDAAQVDVESLIEGDDENHETFREDYELGMYEEDYVGYGEVLHPAGEFYVSYRGHCTVCPFGFDYEHRQQVSFDS